MKSLVTATLFAASFNACAASFDYNAFAGANPAACVKNVAQ